MGKIVAELPARLRVIIAGSSMGYGTQDYCEAVADSFKRNGHPEIDTAEVKRQLWKLINNKPLSFVGDWLKNHVILEGTEDGSTS